MAGSLRQRRAGVDVIALLAVAGALAVGQLLAAAVISVMLASGRALEAWAAGRAHRDLQGLLERAPRTARRYRGGLLESVPAEDIQPGDRLLVPGPDRPPRSGHRAGSPDAPDALQSVLAGMAMSLAAMAAAGAGLPRSGEPSCRKGSTWRSSSTRSGRCGPGRPSGPWPRRTRP